jgi:hypothetical protein
MCRIVLVGEVTFTLIPSALFFFGPLALPFLLLLLKLLAIQRGSFSQWRQTVEALKFSGFASTVSGLSVTRYSTSQRPN